MTECARCEWRRRAGAAQRRVLCVASKKDGVAVDVEGCRWVGWMCMARCPTLPGHVTLQAANVKRRPLSIALRPIMAA
jgi:hypothetical protein